MRHDDGLTAHRGVPVAIRGVPINGAAWLKMEGPNHLLIIGHGEAQILGIVLVSWKCRRVCQCVCDYSSILT